VTACLIDDDSKGRSRKEVRTFGTMADELLALADWLTAAGCTHVAMESTGVYWKPIYNLLEADFTLLLVNAQHIKAVPGRKTDARDCEWIADLLQHGLLCGSVVPTREQRELRELVRYRTALVGRVSAAIAARMEPVADQLAALDTIPGVSQRVAELLIADAAQRAPSSEMAPFRSARHLASWAGMCPGNNESAGTRKSGRTRKGNPWLRSILVEAARAAAHTKGTDLSAHHPRLAKRRGSKRAAVAVGHTILVIAYHLPKEGTTYTDLGGAYFDRRDRPTVERRLVRRLEGLGYKVSLEPVAA
jgi:transposase